MSKESDSLERLATGLSQSRSPVIAWSGGKDSMVLLHLVYNVLKKKVPVLFFREPWQPAKYAFQDRIIKEWGIEAYTWHPFNSALQQNEDEFEVQNYYRFDETILSCPTGITPPVEGKPWACSIDILQRPKQDRLYTGWTDVFIGHKGSDSDPIYGGDAGTLVDCRIAPGGAVMHFPIRHWTHDDIWDYTLENAIPWDSDRYEVNSEGKFREIPDKSINVDYVHACTACIDSRQNAVRFVYCPKRKGVIENCSSLLPWADKSKPSYFKQ